MSHLYLIGMMGSGKSVTARRLAKVLRRQFVDLDSLIEEKNGRSIPQIFAESGESFFRDQEALVLAEASSSSEPSVVATGGGAVLKDINVSKMRASGTIIFLNASLETLWQRVQKNTNRPLLKGENPKGALEKILHQRVMRYGEVSDFLVETDGKSPDTVADDIARILGESV